MTSLLRIDSSSRREGSHSRELADVIAQVWRDKHPGGTVVERDLIADPVPHIANETIAGFYSDPSAYSAETAAAMVLSDALVHELIAADDLLFSVPIYNFSVPSALKAWIDQIVRPGYTFQFNEDGSVIGLLQNKRVYVALAYGLNYSGTDLAAYDFLKPYLETTFGYIGLTDVKFIAVEGTALGDKDGLAAHKRDVYGTVSELVV